MATNHYHKEYEREGGLDVVVSATAVVTAIKMVVVVAMEIITDVTSVIIAASVAVVVAAALAVKMAVATIMFSNSNNSHHYVCHQPSNREIIVEVEI